MFLLIFFFAKRPLWIRLHFFCLDYKTRQISRVKSISELRIQHISHCQTKSNREVQFLNQKDGPKCVRKPTIYPKNSLMGRSNIAECKYQRLQWNTIIILLSEHLCQFLRFHLNSSNQLFQGYGHLFTYRELTSS